jgi:hypothetical protein
MKTIIRIHGERCKWWWELRDERGRTFAISSDMYSRRPDALRGCNRAIARILSGKVELWGEPTKQLELKI